MIKKYIYILLILILMTSQACRDSVALEGEVPEGEVPKGEVPEGEVPEGEVPEYFQKIIPDWIVEGSLTDPNRPKVKIGARAVKVRLQEAGTLKFCFSTLEMAMNCDNTPHSYTGEDGVEWHRFVFPREQHARRTPGSYPIPGTDFDAKCGHPSAFECKPILPGTSVSYKWRHTNAEGEVRDSNVYEFTMPRPLHFVLLGDSYGSGEGNPADFRSSGNQWLSPNGPSLSAQYKKKYSPNEGVKIPWPWIPSYSGYPCHRSIWSGQELALQDISQKSEYQEIGFDHINVSCSGAKTEHIYLKNQVEKAGSKTWWQTGSSQLELAKIWLSQKNYTGIYADQNQKFDLALVSIGGNDASFGDVVTDLVSYGMCQDLKPKLRKLIQMATFKYATGVAGSFTPLVTWFMGKLVDGIIDIFVYDCSSSVSELPSERHNFSQYYEDMINGESGGMNVGGITGLINSMQNSYDIENAIFSGYPMATRGCSKSVKDMVNIGYSLAHNNGDGLKADLFVDDICDLRATAITASSLVNYTAFLGACVTWAAIWPSNAEERFNKCMKDIKTPEEVFNEVKLACKPLVLSLYSKINIPYSYSSATINDLNNTFGLPINNDPNSLSINSQLKNTITNANYTFANTDTKPQIGICYSDRQTNKIKDASSLYTWLTIAGSQYDIKTTGADGESLGLSRGFQFKTAFHPNLLGYDQVYRPVIAEEVSKALSEGELNEENRNKIAEEEGLNSISDESYPNLSAKLLMFTDEELQLADDGTPIGLARTQVCFASNIKNSGGGAVSYGSSEGKNCYGSEGDTNGEYKNECGYFFNQICMKSNPKDQLVDTCLDFFMDDIQPGETSGDYRCYVVDNGLQDTSDGLPHLPFVAQLENPRIFANTSLKPIRSPAKNLNDFNSWEPTVKDRVLAYLYPTMWYFSLHADSRNDIIEPNDANNIYTTAPQGFFIRPDVSSAEMYMLTSLLTSEGCPSSVNESQLKNLILTNKCVREFFGLDIIDNPPQIAIPDYTATTELQNENINQILWQEGVMYSNEIAVLEDDINRFVPPSGLVGDSIAFHRKQDVLEFQVNGQNVQIGRGANNLIMVDPTLIPQDGRSVDAILKLNTPDGLVDKPFKLKSKQINVGVAEESLSQVISNAQVNLRLTYPVNQADSISVQTGVQGYPNAFLDTVVEFGQASFVTDTPQDGRPLEIRLTTLSNDTSRVETYTIPTVQLNGRLNVGLTLPNPERDTTSINVLVLDNTAHLYQLRIGDTKYDGIYYDSGEVTLDASDSNENLKFSATGIPRNNQDLIATLSTKRDGKWYHEFYQFKAPQLGYPKFERGPNERVLNSASTFAWDLIREATAYRIEIYDGDSLLLEQNFDENTAIFNPESIPWSTNEQFLTLKLTAQVDGEDRVSQYKFGRPWQTRIDADAFLNDEDRLPSSPTISWEAVPVAEGYDVKIICEDREDPHYKGYIEDESVTLTNELPLGETCAVIIDVVIDGQNLNQSAIQLFTVTGDRSELEENRCAPREYIDLNTIASGEGSRLIFNNLIGSEQSFNSSQDCGYGSRGPDVVHRFVAPSSGQWKISTVHPDTIFDTVLYVRENCQDQDSQIECNDDAKGRLQSELLIDLEKEQEIFIIIDSYSSSQFGDSPYRLTVEPNEPPPPTITPEESICSNVLSAEDLTIEGLGENFYIFTAQLGGESLFTGSCGGNGPESVFRFVAPVTDNWVFATSADAPDTVLYIRDTCNDVSSERVDACNDDVNPSENKRGSQIVEYLEAGEEVFVFIDTYSTYNGLAQMIIFAEE